MKKLTVVLVMIFGFLLASVYAAGIVWHNGAPVSVNSTAKQISATSVEYLDLIFQSKATNTGTVYFGGSNVNATNGIAIFPGGTVNVGGSNMGDLSNTYLVSDANSTVTYSYTTPQL